MLRTFARRKAYQVVCALAMLPALLWAQKGVTDGQWRYWGGDAGGTRYTNLDQINAENVRNLQIVWRWKSERAENNWQVTPLMIDGTLYVTSGTRRDAVAIDAATGKTLWSYWLDEGERGTRSPRQNNRGLAYWSDGAGNARVLYITPGYHLVALDAKTGAPFDDFGEKGNVDLWVGLDREVQNGDISATSPGIVVGDVVVVGAALQGGTAPRTKTNVPAYVRGYDVRSGKLLWTFHTIPKLGEFGNDTWENDSWQYTGNTGVWAPMAADLELGYVYLPTEVPTGDYYGGHRPGNNLFADSVVCVDAKTGKRVWHYQLIHHDIWDWDTGSAPVLLDVAVDGRPRKIIAQVTKQGWAYVFDRVTGEPIWPIEEKPVEKGTVPGEWYSPTQPSPSKPAAYERQGVSEADLIDLTPEIKAEALTIASKYKLGPIFTPPIVNGTDGKLGVLTLPHNQGASNWQSAVADPETGLFYVPSVTNWWSNSMVEGGTRSEMRYVGGTTRVQGPQGLPLVKGPWGRITAIDMMTGDHRWMVPNGLPPAYVRNHAALQGVDTSGLGNPERAPLLVTKTLLFSGDGNGLFSSGPQGGGPGFRALDKATGKTLFEMQLPANETGLPISYMLGGRQYVVVAIGARNSPAELIALALPQ